MDSSAPLKQICEQAARDPKTRLKHLIALIDELREKAPAGNAVSVTADSAFAVCFAQWLAEQGGELLTFATSRRARFYTQKEQFDERAAACASSQNNKKKKKKKKWRDSQWAVLLRKSPVMRPKDNYPVGNETDCWKAEAARRCADTSSLCIKVCTVELSDKSVTKVNFEPEVCFAFSRTVRATVEAVPVGLVAAADSGPKALNLETCSFSELVDVHADPTPRAKNPKVEHVAKTRTLVPEEGLASPESSALLEKLLRALNAAGGGEELESDDSTDAISSQDSQESMLSDFSASSDSEPDSDFDDCSSNSAEPVPTRQLDLRQCMPPAAERKAKAPAKAPAEKKAPADAPAKAPADAPAKAPAPAPAKAPADAPGPNRKRKTPAQNTASRAKKGRFKIPASRKPVRPALDEKTVIALGTARECGPQFVAAVTKHAAAMDSALSVLQVGYARMGAKLGELRAQQTQLREALLRRTELLAASSRTDRGRLVSPAPKAKNSQVTHHN